MTPINSVSRFEDRMKDCVAKGKLEEAKIIERDSAGAAHRIIAMGEGPAFLANGKNRHLLRESDWDRPEFIKEVRRKIEGLMNADLENHVLLSHLEKGQSTPMAEEALFWDIQIPKGGKPLPDMAVKKIFQGFNILHNLPGEAHRHYPLLLDGYSLGHATRVAVYSALLAQKLEDPELSPEEAAQVGFFHDLGKIQPRINRLVRAPDEYERCKEEFKLIKLHPIIGAAVWENLSEGVVPMIKEKLPKMLIYNGILEHHLRPDGTGYPNYMDPNVTSLIGKVIGLVDSYDAMTTNRKYDQKKKRPLGYAREEMRRCAQLEWDKMKTFGQEPESQFDTNLVQNFLDLDLVPVLRKAA